MKSGSPSRTTAAHKTQTKIQAWSSLVFHCCHSSFNPSEAPPWDSRPVSGAGVVHYQLLHRPRSCSHGSRPRPTRHTAKLEQLILRHFNCAELVLKPNWLWVRSKEYNQGILQVCFKYLAFKRLILYSDHTILINSDSKIHFRHTIKKCALCKKTLIKIVF